MESEDKTVSSSSRELTLFGNQAAVLQRTAMPRSDLPTRLAGGAMTRAALRCRETPCDDAMG